jgi:hypothetical protein
VKFEVRNRFTGEVQIPAEIECAEDAPVSVKLGLAVKWAVKTRANLARANLAGADLAGAYLADANLARVDLADANLAGAYLADANLARADLADAYLARAYLADANLAGAYLADADLADAYLARADLADAYLTRANLAGAYLADANLARVDLADANLAGAYLADANKVDPADIPVIPQIDAAILAAIEAGGSLSMGAWHTCETTHCRAGWAVHLAGEKGYALERRLGPQRAGAMIYRASRPGMHAPWFFASNEEALADLRKCAAEQIARGDGE